MRSRRSASTRRTRTSSSSPSFGKYSVPSEERGVFKSTDGGKTWRKVLYRDANDRRDRHPDRRDESRTSCTRRCGRRIARNIRCRAAARAAACSSRPTAASTGPRSRATPVCPSGIDGKMGIALVGGESESRVGAARERAGRRSVSLGGRRRDLGVDQHEPRGPSARVLLHAHRRRSEERRRAVLPERVGVQVDRRRQEHERRARIAQRQPRPVGRSGQLAAPRARQRRRRRGVDERRRTWTARGLFDARSSITSRSTAHIPYDLCGAQQDDGTICVHSNANLGGGGGRGFGGGGGGGGGGRGGAAPARPTPTAPADRRTATSRPTRRIPTSTMPAATTARSSRD